MKGALSSAYIHSGWYLWQVMDCGAGLRRKRRSAKPSVHAGRQTRQKDIDLVLSCSAIELARMIRTRQITAVEVVDRCIEQLHRVNSQCNAVVAMRVQEARQEAQSADQLIEDFSKNTNNNSNNSTALPVLLGVPFIVKENIQVKGMPNTCGLVVRQQQGILASRNALVVENLINAGGIVLGVSNLSELCFWNECYNNVYGRTRNPYNRERIAGGSSGGSAVAVSACGVPFSLGTDLAGSVRFPSFCNGVFGHKPSALRVSCDGQFPKFHCPRRQWLNTVGHITRHSEDLWQLLTIMDSDPNMHLSVHPSDIDLSKFGMLCVTETGLPVRCNQSEPIVKMKQVAAHLSKVCHVQYVADHDKTIAHLWKRYIRHSHAMFMNYMFHESNNDTTLCDLLSGKDAEHPAARTFHKGRELVKYAFSRSDYTLMSLVSSLGDLQKISGHRLLQLADEFRDELQSIFEPFGGRGIILFPSFFTTAPRRKRTATILTCSRTLSIFNVLGLPVTQVPLGLSQQMDPGMPLGLQVASLRGCDHVTIRVAMELEQAFGGWVPPGIV